MTRKTATDPQNEKPSRALLTAKARAAAALATAGVRHLEAAPLPGGTAGVDPVVPTRMPAPPWGWPPGRKFSPR
eukprot:382990-Pyramimonas_sp.AAC.2